jgi:hypothetical protein
MKLIFNPITAEFEIKENNGSPTQDLILEADSSVTVGDIVRIESPDLVVTCEDNLNINPAFAIVTEKPTPTTAKLMLMGYISGYSGLIPGRTLYLANDGSIAQIPPNSGENRYQQALGVALSETKILFKPEFQRLRRL